MRAHHAPQRLFVGTSLLFELIDLIPGSSLARTFPLRSRNECVTVSETKLAHFY